MKTIAFVFLILFATIAFAEVPTAGTVQLVAPKVSVNGVDILASKAGAFVHLQWTVAGPPAQHLVFRGTLAPPFYPPLLIGWSYSDSFDDPVINDGNNYFYQVFRVDP